MSIDPEAASAAAAAAASAVPPGSTPLSLPDGCGDPRLAGPVAWTVEPGSAVRAGDVVGHYGGGGGGGGAGTAGGSGAGGGGQIRPRRRAGPGRGGAGGGRGGSGGGGGGPSRPRAAGGGGSRSGSRCGGGGGGGGVSLSLGSLVAGLGRTASTLTGNGADDGSSRRERRGGAGGSNGGPASASASASVATDPPASSAGARPAPRTALRAPADGFLHFLRPGAGGAREVAYVEPCTHPAIVGGLCAVCGARLAGGGGGAKGGTPPPASSSFSPTAAAPGASAPPPYSLSSASATALASGGHLTVSGGITVSVSEGEARSIAAHSSARLRAARRLSLVLDLDHTLLHATADPRAGEYVRGTGRAGESGKGRTDVRSLLLPTAREDGPADGSAEAGGGADDASPAASSSGGGAGGGGDGLPPPGEATRHYVKLRPHLREFLLDTARRYEMTIYTAGTRSYAHRVAQLICRHLVDAPMDEEGLGLARRCLADAERRRLWLEARALRRRSVEVANGKIRTAVDRKGGKKGRGEVPVAGKGGGPEGKANDEGGDSPNSIPRKRRKVSFEPAAKTKDGEGPEVDGVQETGGSSKASAKERAEREEDERVKLEATIERLRSELKEAERHEKKATDLRMKMFGSRIVSRTDVSDLGRDVKSLRRVFPCGGTMAAIIDDREDVWANAKNNATGRPGEPPDNLLLVRPYHWKPFIGFADVNNAAGADMTKAATDGEEKKEESIEDEEKAERKLLWMRDILRRVHEQYYSPDISEEKRDGLSVPGILSSMRKAVLGSSPKCNLVLSGVVPLHMQNQIAREGARQGPRPGIVRYAEVLGAKVLPDVTDKVTHVVARQDGTSKVLKARLVPGCAVVRISWLMECYWSLTRRDLSLDNLIGPPPIQKPVKKEGDKNEETGRKVMLLTGSDSSESEDEDLAAEFEMDMISSI